MSAAQVIPIRAPRRVIPRPELAELAMRCARLSAVRQTLTEQHHSLLEQTRQLRQNWLILQEMEETSAQRKREILQELASGAVLE